MQTAFPTIAAGAARAAPVRGTVVVYSREGRDYASRHERATRLEIGRRLAALKGCAFAGEHDRSARHEGPVYFVPNDTLTRAEAAALGIRGWQDLFGAVVPHPFVATKAITHPLVSPEARAPAGWSHEFQRRTAQVVLPGFTAFTREDARRAAAQLLERGAVRVKPVHATGGRGQTVVAAGAQLEACLEAIDDAELACFGLVLEENLTDVITYSVGQVCVAGLVATYHGRQRLTSDNRGAEVYGGSDLTVVRGGFEALLALDLPAGARLAVQQARLYDAAATQCFAGFFASRNNYDVAAGMDCKGQPRCGVLEQSWRVGGASSAEIAAVEALRADPTLQVVRASCVEVFGHGQAPPPQAAVYFHGIDEQVGPLLKYALVAPHGHP